MPKALIYCRVSTEEQVQQGYSLEAQEKFCRQFALSNSYEVAGVYRDEGKSGTNLDRPALQELLSRVQQEKIIAAVIVQETDRLARNTKDHLTIRALLQKLGTKLISVAQPMLDDSPEGRMVDTIIASVNQFQSDVNARKIMKGMQEKFDSGCWPGWAPLGYLNKILPNNRRIVVTDPQNFHLIRSGFKMYLTGNYSVSAIASMLYKKGVHSRSGKRICNTVMTDMLKNPFYARLMRWDGKERIGKHKPMISLGEHRRILGILEQRNYHASRSRKHQFLLTGFVFCNICGQRYTAEIHPRKNKAYYHCTLSMKRIHGVGHTNKGQNVEIHDLEKQVQRQFKGIEFSKSLISNICQKLQKVYMDQRRSNEAQKRLFYNQKLAIERKRDIVEEKLIEGVISNRDFIRIRDKYQTQLGQIQYQLDDLENRRQLDIEGIREILSLTRNTHETYIEASKPLKRLYLGLFWQKFLVRDKKIIKAIPTDLIQNLIEERKVIIRSNWWTRADSNR